MHRNFAMMVLQTVSPVRAEACPPPFVSTTNKPQPFGHRRRKKSWTHPMVIRKRFAGSRAKVGFGPLLSPQTLSLRPACGFVGLVADDDRLGREPHHRQARFFAGRRIVEARV